MKTFSLIAAAVLFPLCVACSKRSEQTSLVEIYKAGEVVIRGGYETDSRDHGRPVNLIAAALDVTPNVFREAFRGVHPAQGGDPTRSQIRENKRALMEALSRYGVTNDRLDEVSDFYRYNHSGREVWSHAPAVIAAIVEEGNVTEIEIVEPGRGYTQAPTVKIFGHEEIQLEAEIEFSTDLQRNGRISRVRVIAQNDATTIAPH